jgi:asparagine synthase (glutamine-hydrolysing)
MSMAHGLEARSPFLDHKLAEFAATLPVHLKIRGRSRRWLQMRLARRYIPPEVLRRPKQGFNSPLPYVMRAQFEALFTAYLGDMQLVQAGYLDRRAIEQMLAAHIAGRSDHGNRLWLLLNAELWHRLKIGGESLSDAKARVAEALGRTSARRPHHAMAAL